VGKRCGAFSTAQHFINKRLIDAAQRYPVVVRLKGGDPMLFGRAQEEIDALQKEGIVVEVVPGVTAALAASAELKVSLTRRTLSRSVVFATPRIGKDASASDWLQAVLAADTAVLYMAYGELARIATLLIAKGKPQELPVAIVQGASLDGPSALVVTLSALTQFHTAPAPGDLPVVVCLGEVYRELLDTHGTSEAAVPHNSDVARCRSVVQ
jgi:uroporphyrin-III C-methyltransferase